MTDLTYATRVLLRAISDLKVDTPVHADTAREAFDLAGVKATERPGAFTAARHAGYLATVHEHLPDGTLVIHCVQSGAESRKGAVSFLYRRTSKPVPEHVCRLDFVEQQGDSRYTGPSKTAPGVASTNTGSLAPTPLSRKEA